MDLLFGPGPSPEGGNGGGGTGEGTDFGHQRTGFTGSEDGDEKIKTWPTGKRHEILVLEPSTLNDWENLIQQLMDRRTLMINMHNLSAAEGQRLVDMLAGAVKALNGTYVAIKGNVFVFSPSTIQLTSVLAGHHGQTQQDFKANAREYAYAG